jgi:hypothetical protein
VSTNNIKGDPINQTATDAMRPESIATTFPYKDCVTNIFPWLSPQTPVGDEIIIDVAAEGVAVITPPLPDALPARNVIILVEKLTVRILFPILSAINRALSARPNNWLGALKIEDVAGPSSSDEPPPANVVRIPETDTIRTLFASVKYTLP